MPSRITRIFVLRVILPSRTRQPATVPTFVILNVSMTSTEQTISSFITGASMPSIASLMSLIAS